MASGGQAGVGHLLGGLKILLKGLLGEGPRGPEVLRGHGLGNDRGRVGEFAHVAWDQGSKRQKDKSGQFPNSVVYKNQNLFFFSYKNS